MNCENCDSQLPENAKFCMECGMNVEPASEEDTTSQEASARDASNLTKRQTVIAVSVFAIIYILFTFFQNGFGGLYGKLTGGGNVSPQQAIGSDLSLSYDPNYLGDGEPCSDSFCQFFSVGITNNGDSPVDLYYDICLVANGKTYSENFGNGLYDTLNPGATGGFDAAFRPESGAHVTELYVGSCSAGTKVASLSLDYKS